jgi:hypothetical protein
LDERRSGVQLAVEFTGIEPYDREPTGFEYAEKIMQREVNDGRKPWNAPKLQRLPTVNANGVNGKKGDQGNQTRS